MQNRVPASTKI